jgi:hypothetical protein
MKILFRTLLLWLLTFKIAASQDMDYARRVIDSLCSPGMHGRGYVHKGDRIAARFIRNEFISLGLKPLGKNYFQSFSLSVNTFPKRMSLSISGKGLIPGRDFLIDPASGKARGRYRLYNVTSTSLRGTREMLKNTFLLVDKKEASTRDEINAMELWTTKPAGARGVIMIEDNKLNWSVSRKRLKHPVFRVLRQALPPEASQVEVKADVRYRKKYRTQNIIGYVPGTLYSDTFIIFTAHYDHLGRMGAETLFPGANDNASGISMLLNLARYYARNPLPYSVAFIAFAAEEAGLLGSEYFVKKPLIPLKQIKFLLNMDIVGTGEEGLMVVNGQVFTDHFNLLEDINKKKNYVVSLQKRGKARNSDHYWFTERGVKSFFIYTLGGVSHYHDINDRPETLPLTDYADIFRLIVEFIDRLKEI